jgi:hypothetical protein
MPAEIGTAGLPDGISEAAKVIVPSELSAELWLTP